MNQPDGSEEVARRSAARLVDIDPGLPDQVEQALAEDPLSRPADRILDPISLGALIVSIASLGWTVYHDTKKDHDTAGLDRAGRTRHLTEQLQESELATGPNSDPIFRQSGTRGMTERHCCGDRWFRPRLKRLSGSSPHRQMRPQKVAHLLDRPHLHLRRLPPRKPRHLRPRRQRRHIHRRLQRMRWRIIRHHQHRRLAPPRKLPRHAVNKIRPRAIQIVQIRLDRRHRHDPAAAPAVPAPRHPAPS